MTLNMNQRHRIMVIENDEDIIRLLDRALEIGGFETIMVTDDMTAIDLLPKIKPDMVIMDIVNTDEKILATIDSMRHLSDVPIVILTSSHEIESMKQIFAHGADDYIHKPWSTRIFLARVQAKLRRQRLYGSKNANHLKNIYQNPLLLS